MLLGFEAKSSFLQLLRLECELKKKLSRTCWLVRPVANLRGAETWWNEIETCPRASISTSPTLTALVLNSGTARQSRTPFSHSHDATRFCCTNPLLRRTRHLFRKMQEECQHCLPPAGHCEISFSAVFFPYVRRTTITTAYMFSFEVLFCRFSRPFTLLEQPDLH
jgi:hypothetical protein